jgi:hypothetical protein
MAPVGRQFKKACTPENWLSGAPKMPLVNATIAATAFIYTKKVTFNQQ